MLRPVSRPSGRILLALLFLALAPGLVFGQQGRGRRGGGGGGLGGGFGAGPAALLAMTEVQNELKLTDDQKSKLRESLSEAGGGGNRGAGNREDFRNLSDEERQKRMEEFRKRAEERAAKANELIQATLSPEQLGRLGELRLQREGFSALARTDVAAALMVTDAQKEAIGEILEAARQDRGAGGAGLGRGGSDEDRQKAVEQMRERRRKTQADIEAVLTDDQKATWQKMQGAKFDFPERGGRGGAGGRQRQRPAE